MVSPKDMDKNPVIESLDYKMPATVQVKIPENAIKIHRIEGPDKEDIAFDINEETHMINVHNNGKHFTIFFEVKPESSYLFQQLQDIVEGKALKDKDNE